MEFALSQSHDLGALSRDYAVKNRLQIRDFFDESTAEEIHQRLLAMNWWLTFNEGEKVNQLRPEQLAQLQQQEAMQIQQKVYQGAQAGYQFLYNYYPLFSAYFSPQVEDMPLFPVYEFINSPGFLDFIRKLTGLDDIRWADAHATLYRAGHFLKFHTDEKPTDKRRAAYVLNFTKDWGRDWGGLLQFWDKKYDVEQAYRPIFNGLNIFTVPADHSVSVVAPYCPGLRFSITGWMRADDPPGDFGQR